MSKPAYLVAGLPRAGKSTLACALDMPDAQVIEISDGIFQARIAQNTCVVGLLLVISAPTLAEDALEVGKLGNDLLKVASEQTGGDRNTPVYLLLAKADLLPGFAEFFADIKDGARSAVCGVTRDADAPQPAAWLAQRLSSGLLSDFAGRLHDKGTAPRASPLLAFAAALLRLCENLSALIECLDTKMMVRGAYLTAIPEKETPFGRLTMASATVLHECYFTTNLVPSLLLPEAGLGSKAISSSAPPRRLTIAMACVGAAILTTGFLSGIQQQNRVSSAVNAAKQAMSRAAMKAGTDVPSMLTTLDAYRDVAARAHAFVVPGFGDRGLVDQADAAYRSALSRLLAPWLSERLEQPIRPTSTDAGGQTDRTGETTLRASAVRRWLSTGAADMPTASQLSLTQHVETLLAQAPLALPAKTAGVTSRATTPSRHEATPIAEHAKLPMGDPADVYARSVVETCRATVNGRYPFFRSGSDDASAAAMHSTFGRTAILPEFLEQRLKPLLMTSGPIWRWRSGNPATKTLDPTTPDELAKVGGIVDLVANGIDFSISVKEFSGGVSSAEISFGKVITRFSNAAAPAQALRWELPDVPAEGSVKLFNNGRLVDHFDVRSIWTPFRLFDLSHPMPDGDRAKLATFSSTAGAVTFRISVQDNRDPFGRSGIWSFRCPNSL